MQGFHAMDMEVVAAIGLESEVMRVSISRA